MIYELFCFAVSCKATVLFPGGDDRRVLLWHMEKAIQGRTKPIKLKGEHLSNIFCLAFDSTNTKVFSGGKAAPSFITVMRKTSINKTT